MKTQSQTIANQAPSQDPAVLKALAAAIAADKKTLAHVITAARAAVTYGKKFSDAVSGAAAVASLYADALTHSAHVAAQFRAAMLLALVDPSTPITIADGQYTAASVLDSGKGSLVLSGASELRSALGIGRASKGAKRAKPAAPTAAAVPSAAAVPTAPAVAPTSTLVPSVPSVPSVPTPVQKPGMVPPIEAVNGTPLTAIRSGLVSLAKTAQGRALIDSWLTEAGYQLVERAPAPAKVKA